MLHTRFKAESPVLRVGSCHGTQPKVTGLSALPRKANLDKPAACRAPSDETQFPHDFQPRAQLLSQRAVSGHRRIRLIRVGRGPLILLEHLEKTAQRVNQFAARNTAFPELNA